MKKLLYVFALVSAVILSGCDNVNNNQPGGGEGSTQNDPEDVDGMTPKTDKTKLWIAGTDSTKLTGYIDETGTMVIPAVYMNAYEFSCGLALVTTEDNEWFFIDKNGKKSKSIDASVLRDAYFYYNKLLVRSGGLYGMWDTNFNEVIPTSYVRLGNATKDGLISFFGNTSSGEGYGYINNNGSVVVDPQFYYVNDFENGIAVVEVKQDGNTAYGLINTKGEYLIKPQEYALYNLGYGLVGYMDESGDCVIIDKTGKQLVENKYQNINHFYEGLAEVRKDGKYGFINTNCEEVIAPTYQYVSGYCSDGVIWVKVNQDTRWKLISKDGQTILQLMQEEIPASVFHNGLALVFSQESMNAYTYRYIDKDGKTIYTWTNK